MIDTSLLLTEPGSVIASLLVPRVPGDDEARASLEVTFGLVFWLVVLLVVRLAWTRLRRLMTRARVIAQPLEQGLADELREAGGVVRRSAASVSWPVVWGVAWRAQVVHVVLYAAMPLLWEGARLALLVVLLPFTIMSFADQTRSATDGTLDHLARPACWTFVGLCPGPRSAFLHDSVVDAATCVTPGNCAPGRTRVTDTGGWLWKALWALVTIAWIGLWRRRVRQRNGAPATVR